MSDDRNAYQWALHPAWSELQAQLDALRGNVERMLQETPDASDVYGKFAGMARPIVERAPPELVESVHSELGSILQDLKLTGDSAD